MLDLQVLVSLLEAVESGIPYTNRKLDQAIDMVYAAIQKQDK